MALEPRGKVVDATTSITSYIRHLSDLVEHMAASEQENTDQAQACPNIAVLDDGEHIRPGLENNTCDAQSADNRYYPSDVIDWSAHSRVRSVRQVPREPYVHILGRLRSKKSISIASNHHNPKIITYPLKS